MAAAAAIHSTLLANYILSLPPTTNEVGTYLCSKYSFPKLGIASIHGATGVPTMAIDGYIEAYQWMTQSIATSNTYGRAVHVFTNA